MRLTSNIKLCINVLFLFSASAFSILLLSAFTNESVLNEFGHAYLESYVSHNRKLVDSALDQLESGHTQKSLDLLQKQFADIQKGDRLYPDKRKILKKLVAYLHQQQDRNWKHWATIWWQLDPRDVSAMIYYQLSLLQSENGYHQDTESLKKLFNAYPEHYLWTELSIFPASVTQSAQ